METKTCSLTDDEIKSLIMLHGAEMREDDIDASIERMNYLNKRLKAKPKDEKPEDQPKAQMSPEETKATTTW
jgi:hypothetical protein